MDAAAVEALGWALVHFLWQGVAIALALELALLAGHRWSAEVRYLARCAALVAMAAAPPLTFLVARDGVGEAAAAWTRETAAEPGLAERALPWVVLAWSLGAAVCLGRLARGLWRVRAVSRSAPGAPLPAPWRAVYERLAGALGVRAAARVVDSAAVAVPAVVGWLKPVVLVPARVFTGLSEAQIEALLAHELAHVRRHDVLVNLAQSVLEALLFYHPAVWWVSAGIRTEREYCCDDLALSVTRDRLSLARALALVEGWRGEEPELCMSTRGGPLMKRIRRLIGRNERTRRSHGVWSALGAGVAAALLGTALLGLAPEAAAQDRGQDVQTPERYRELSRTLRELQDQLRVLERELQALRVGTPAEERPAPAEPRAEARRRPGPAARPWLERFRARHEAEDEGGAGEGGGRDAVRRLHLRKLHEMLSELPDDAGVRHRVHEHLQEAAKRRRETLHRSRPESEPGPDDAETLHRHLLERKHREHLEHLRQLHGDQAERVLERVHEVLERQREHEHRMHEHRRREHEQEQKQEHEQEGGEALPAIARTLR